MSVQNELKKLASSERKRRSESFFKLGPGQYGEGDLFIGVSMPDLRKVIKGFSNLTLPEITSLLDSKIHEERMAGLLLLVERFKKEPQKSYDLYVKKMDRVNNWDLVDLSAPPIIGGYLFDKKGEVLFKWAASKKLWTRRVAIVATQYFIKKGALTTTFELAKILLGDNEDLMHKATGWMLREAGKRDEKALKDFLDEYTPQMPRTMLRYSIEKFTPEVRKHYLSLS